MRKANSENFGSGEGSFSASAESVVKQKKITLLISVLLIFIAVGIAYFYYQQSASLKNDPERAGQAEMEAVVKKVSRLMELPANEKPILATVSDLARLKEQAFFANAQLGDKLLLFTVSRKAILYSETADKIIEVAPISFGNATK